MHPLPTVFRVLAKPQSLVHEIGDIMLVLQPTLHWPQSARMLPLGRAIHLPPALQLLDARQSCTAARWRQLQLNSRVISDSVNPELGAASSPCTGILG
jgi:hypothetical protein